MSACRLFPCFTRKAKEIRDFCTWGSICISGKIKSYCIQGSLNVYTLQFVGPTYRSVNRTCILKPDLGPIRKMKIDPGRHSQRNRHVNQNRVSKCACDLRSDTATPIGRSVLTGLCIFRLITLTFVLRAMFVSRCLIVFFFSQPSYVLHIFPPCDFAQEHLARVSPDLLDSAADSGHLMVVVASV